MGLSVVMGEEILSHILENDANPFRQEQINDFDDGLAGDLAEEDVLDLMKEHQHGGHMGVCFRNPQYHHLNEKPNDYLSPYKVVGEVTQSHQENHH